MSYERDKAEWEDPRGRAPESLSHVECPYCKRTVFFDESDFEYCIEKACIGIMEHGECCGHLLCFTCSPAVEIMSLGKCYNREGLAVFPPEKPLVKKKSRLRRSPFLG